MKAIIVSLCAAMLAACSNSGDFRSYIEAQERLSTLAVQNRKPLVEITAHEGQAITGLQSLKVYAPDAASAPQVQQARPNEWASVADRALGVVGQGLGLKLGGAAAIGIAREVGKAANHGYDYVNPPTVIAPDPVVVPPPDPVIVPTPDPIIVPPPDPIFVPAPVAGGE
ncbi:hypothetical protein [Pseudazoarcus pumilus]|uniref:Uncharacterized protein n=1 Tax=Pseudazoarcus pumilus TaxID=2067960 RepID=A0A2I6S9C7_9RHOO|nr:hypothetical protein [Pseudazoarcus pumilus]AUN95866.1 hypothetical protein C0099_13560 [Pseudazoarcus pumilus]